MARHPRHTERTAARDARALCSRHHQLRSGPSPWPTTNISNTFASSSSGNTSHPPVHLALPTSRRSKAAIGDAWHTAGALSCVSTPPTQNSFPPPTNLPHLRLLPWLDSFEPQDANTRSHMHSESTRKIRPRNTMPSEDGIRLSETRSARVKLGVPYYIEEPPPEFPRGNSAKRPALPALTLCSCRRAVLRHLPLPSRIACSYCAVIGAPRGFSPSSCTHESKPQALFGVGVARDGVPSLTVGLHLRTFFNCRLQLRSRLLEGMLLADPPRSTLKRETRRP